MSERVIERDEVVGLLFDVADIAEVMKRIGERLEEDGEEEENDED